MIPYTERGCACVWEGAEALLDTSWHRRAGCARLIEQAFNYKSSILHVVFTGAGAVNNNAETS